jgi:hypothetical protein
MQTLDLDFKREKHFGFFVHTAIGKKLITLTSLVKVKARLHWQCFYGNITGDTQQSLLTCLGHLGQSDRDKNDPNCQGE